MLHRATLGTLERFLGVYLEHRAGHFPTWLAPTQVYLVPVRENHFDYTKKLEKELKALGIRVENDLEPINMGKKVRKATIAQVPYIAVAGDREMAEGTLSIKSPLYGDFGPRPISVFQNGLLQEIKTRDLSSFIRK